jgi:hypothetical protein
MLRKEFKPTIPVCERAQTFHTLDLAVAVIGRIYVHMYIDIYINIQLEINN